MDIKLKFWQNGPVLRNVAAVAGAMFDRLRAALDRLSALADAESCPQPVLALLAWHRGVTRLSGEGDALFRRRVKHAFANSLDAGSVVGFMRIWERLELGSLVQHERTDGRDWDVIVVQLDDAKFAPYRGLFEQLVALYGRTCRRYILEQPATPGQLGVRPFVIDCTTNNFKAVY
ncbi:phage tail protein [Victivallis sp. Marseille-Q1083]|uniref:phage tail protein n=1 Tax=Victivallis sp. Marseille-Q1083 TaxID=2717288 RepID=UPI00158F4F63|nr:phage tail protein [Victivallis sp. Marseille-Q1083]